MGQQTDLAIRGVLYAQPYRDGNGAEQIAPEDIVILTTIVGGAPVHQVRMTPEQALAVARELTTSASALINAEVDDAGKPTNLLHRLRRLSAKAGS